MDAHLPRRRCTQPGFKPFPSWYLLQQGCAVSEPSGADDRHHLLCRPQGEMTVITSCAVLRAGEMTEILIPASSSPSR